MTEQTTDRINGEGSQPPLVSRCTYFIRPFTYRESLGDSGRIDGREGAGGGMFYELPITGDDGGWLEFDSFEAAEVEAIKRGFDHRNVTHEWVEVCYPAVDPSVPASLDTEQPSNARYSQLLQAEVMDSLIEAQDNRSEPLGLDLYEFLAALWRRGFKVVPNGDGQWSGDDNTEPQPPGQP